MQTVAMVAGPCQRAAAAPTSRRGPAAACLAPLRGAASSHAAPQRRQPAAQAARSSWGSSGWRQRRCWALAAVPEPEFHPVDQEKLDKFKELNKDYAVVTQQIEETATELVEGLQGTSLYLVGMMGSGKSTVGKMISKALGYCFFDTDEVIEQLAAKSVTEIFAEDGEEEFRQLETQVLMELAPFKNCVVSTGGGVPTRAENWGHMQGGISVWLNGPPTLLARRVTRDGTDSRPLLSQEEGEAGGDAFDATVARLSALLEQREPLYRGADITVSLEGSGPDADIGAPAMEVCLRVLSAINQRIKDDAEERKRRMDFEIVREDLPPTMRVVDSPAAAAAAAKEADDPFLP